MFSGLFPAILLEDGPILKGDDFAPQPFIAPDKINQQANMLIAPQMNKHEFNTMINAINATGGNKSKAAKLLGLSRDAFLYRLKKHKL